MYLMKQEDLVQINPQPSVDVGWYPKVNRIFSPALDFVFGTKCTVCGKRKRNMTYSAFHSGVCLDCLFEKMGLD